MPNVKLINVSDKVFEFTWDGRNFPAIPPGGMVDLPEDIARHALRKSEVLDDEGMPQTRRLQTLEAATHSDPQKVNKILVFSCPFADTDGCKEPPMPRDKFLKHLQQHSAAKASQKEADY